MIMENRMPKSAKLVRTSTTFSATFNLDPAYLGMYSFGYSAFGNSGITILNSKRGSVYLVNRATVSGTIWEKDFLESLYINPELKFQRIVGGFGSENVYQTVMPVTSYYSEQPFTAYFASDKEGDGIKVSFSGVLNQTADLIGITTVKIILNLSIYEINENEYNRLFRSEDINPFLNK